MKYYTASTWRRLTAAAIDQLIVMFLLLPVWLGAWQSYMSYGYFEIEWKWLLIGFVFQFLYKWSFLKLLGGTLGKLLVGLRVVRSHDEQPLLWIQSFLRVLADHLTLFFGEATHALMLFRFDRTHLSDWIAETKVVQFQPRMQAPQRRVILGIFLVVYLAGSSFVSTYQLVQSLEWGRSGVRYYWQSIPPGQEF